MVAKLFRVVMKADAACRLRERPGDEPARWLFSYEGGAVRTMAIDDIVTTVSEIPFSDGPRFGVEIEAASVDAAATAAHAWAETTAILLATARRAPVGVLFPDVAYEVTPGAAEREFRQWFWDLPLLRSAPAVSQEAFEALHTKVHALGAKPETQRTMWRLVLSMSWFRQGVSEDEAIFRFLKFWLALEALGPILADRFEVDGGEGSPFLHRLASAVGLGAEWVSHAKGVRRKVFHALRVTRSELQAETSALLPNVERLLVHAWQVLLDYPGSTLPAESVAPHRPYACIHALVLHEDAATWNWDAHPYFDAAFGAVREKTTDPRELKIRLTQQYALRNAAGYRPIALETRGPGGPGQVRMEAVTA